MPDQNSVLSPITKIVQSPAVQPPSSPPVSQDVPTKQFTHAGFWIRWSAYFIDILVLLVISYPLAALLILPVALLSGESLSKAYTQFPTSTIFTGIVAIAVWSYFVFMTEKYGATLGKKALKLKVIPTQGQNLTIMRVILREVVGKLVSGLIFMIGYIMAAFSSKKQALHDHIAGTYVIQMEPATGITKVVIFLTIFAPIVLIILLQLIIFGSVFFAFIQS